MATKKAPAPVEAVEAVEAFVLRDCGFGETGDVVVLSVEDARVGATNGMLDLHPDAIKAAKANGRTQ